MLDLEAIGTRLREERKRLRMTQAELAARVGVSRAAIVTYESGRTPFDVSFMDQLKELGVRTGYVLSGVDGVRRGFAQLGHGSRAHEQDRPLCPEQQHRPRAGPTHRLDADPLSGRSAQWGGG